MDIFNQFLPALESFGHTASIVVPDALKLGLIYSLTVLALFLSYSMLNVCDLSTDGCFTLGAVVGTMVAISGRPYLAIAAAMFAGMLSGFVAATLQTRMGVDSLLAGIVVNTGLYSVNVWLMGGRPTVSIVKADTVFSMLKSVFKGTPLAGYQDLLIAAIAVVVIIAFLSQFLKTKLGLAIRATGNNMDMVRSSSINPTFTITVGLCISNSFTALSGCLLAQSQKSAEVGLGTGVLTVALASLLIGRTLFGRGNIFFRAVGVVVGSIIFQLVYTIALQAHVDAYWLKLTSSVIVVLAICLPYLRSQFPLLYRRYAGKRGTKC